MESMNSCASLLPSLVLTVLSLSCKVDFDIVKEILCGDDDNNDRDDDACETKGKDADEEGADGANVRIWALDDNRVNDEALLRGLRPLPRSRIDVDVSE